MKKLLLVDGNSIMNRAFYGIPLLSNSEGVFTNAVYGFINIVTKILEDEKASHVVIAFDLKGPTFRNEIYPDYKGTRKSMPEELRPQMKLVKEVLKAMEISICEIQGYEADDVLGTLAYSGEQSGYEVALLSGDKDMLQLATERTKIIIPKTKSGTTTYEQYFDRDVMDKYGVTPTEFIDVKGLMGDASDNIPGIPGVGEKTALKLISKYHTIEAAYEDRESFAKGLKGKISDYIDQAVLSRKLASIITDVALDFSIDHSEIGEIYTKEAYDYFVKLNMNSLLGKFTAMKMEKEPDMKVEKISDSVNLDRLLSEAKACYYHLVFDNSLTALAFICDQSTYYYTDSRLIDKSHIDKAINDLILNEAIKKITYDFKLQLHQIDAPMSLCAKSMTDLSLMMYLINPVSSHYEIDKIATEYGGISYIGDDGFLGKGKSLKSLIDIDEDDLINRSVLAIHAIKQAYPKIVKEVDEKNLMGLYNTIELPLLYVLYRMEKRGIKVDGEQLKAFAKRLMHSIEILEKEIFEMAGESFNISSPKQLGVILFEKMALPFAKKTKTGYATSVDILERIKPFHPIVEAIISYRQLTKLKSTYADGLFEYIQEDGRIHSTFNQKVASTGRISSQDPNLQNIPIRLELGREIRKVFVPQDGFIFIDADYSQIELRLLAHLSEDASFIKAFREELDIHRMTASQVFHIPFEEVTDLQRRNAKAVNFGIVYGISAFGLSRDLNIGVKEAGAYIDQYFEKYPKVKSFLDGCINQAKNDGYVKTMYNRIRPVPELASSNYVQRSFGERVAMNTPIQGSAADVIKIAMINVEKRLVKEKSKARLILQVHDELLIEAPIEDQEYIQSLLVEEMEQAVLISVPLTVDAHIGKNWYESK